MSKEVKLLKELKEFYDKGHDMSCEENTEYSHALSKAITALEAIEKAGDELPITLPFSQENYRKRATPVLAKKDIRIKELEARITELEKDLESDCCADNCQEVAMLQAKIDELEEERYLIRNIALDIKSKLTGDV